MAKIINEFAAVKTDNEYVLCAQYDNGRVIKTYERRMISDNQFEVIQHRNRDRAGSYYTTRHIYNGTHI